MPYVLGGGGLGVLGCWGVYRRASGPNGSGMTAIGRGRVLVVNLGGQDECLGQVRSSEGGGE